MGKMRARAERDPNLCILPSRGTRRSLGRRPEKLIDSEDFDWVRTFSKRMPRLAW